jgi:hypothetical protein
MASVIGVKGRRLTVARRYEPAQGEIADRDQLHLAEVVLDEMPADILSFAQTLRPTLDQLANAVGIPASLNFDEKGDYIQRR